MPKYDKADVERRMAGAVESLKGDLGGLRVRGTAGAAGGGYHPTSAVADGHRQ